MGKAVTASTALPMTKEYWVAFLQTSTSRNLLVEGFSGGATSCTNLWLYFMHRHLEYTIVVLNKVPGPNPWYKQCDMFIPQKAMVTGNLDTII